MVTLIMKKPVQVVHLMAKAKKCCHRVYLSLIIVYAKTDGFRLF